jgi:hypothetical protein
VKPKWLVLTESCGSSKNSAGSERYVNNHEMFYVYYGPTYQLPDERYVYASEEGPFIPPFWRIEAYRAQFEN